MGKRCCCNRLLCCCGSSPEEWSLDLGSGGWSAGRCDRCDEVTGEFTLRHTTTEPGHEFACVFLYLDDEWCDDSYVEHCAVGDFSGKIALKVTLRIPLASPAPTCTINATVRLLQFFGIDATCTAQCFADYSAVVTKAEIEGCFDETLRPLTLTKDDDGCPTNGGLSPLCVGLLPETITIAPV